MIYLLQVPEDMLSKCRLSYIELGDPVSIEELGKRTQDPGSAGYKGYIESCIQGLLKVRGHRLTNTVKHEIISLI